MHQVRSEILAGAVPAGLQETACEKRALTTAQPAPMSKVTAGEGAASGALQGSAGARRPTVLPPPTSFSRIGLPFPQMEGSLLTWHEPCFLVWIPVLCKTPEAGTHTPWKYAGGYRETLPPHNFTVSHYMAAGLKRRNKRI